MTEPQFNPNLTLAERADLAIAHATPAEILATLYDPEDENRAIDRYDISPYSLLASVYIYLAVHENTPDSIHQLLLTNGAKLRCMVASHARNSNTLRTLYQAGPALWHSLAENPNLPADILEDLLKRDIPSLNHLIAENPNTPNEALGELLRIAPYCRDEVIENIEERQEFENYPIEWVEEIIQHTTNNNSPANTRKTRE